MRDVTRRAIELTLVVAGAVAATVPLTATFAASTGVLVATALAAVAAAALSTAVLTRWPPLAQAGAAFVTVGLTGLITVEAAALIGTRRATVPPGDAWSLVVGTWDATRAGGVPAPLEPDLLVLPMIVAVTAAWLAGMAVRWRPAVSVVPFLAAFAVSLCFTAGQPVVLAAPLALLVVGLGLVRLGRVTVDRTTSADSAETTGTRAGRGRRIGTAARALAPAAIALMTVSGVVLLAVTALPGLADDGRTDLRETYSPPVVTVREPNVLSLVAAGLARRADPPVVFRVQIDGPAPAPAPGPDADTVPDRAPDAVPDRTRLAVLDRYDGTTWTSSGRFAALDEEQAVAPDGPDAVAQTYSATDGHATAFLPAIDRPISVTSLAGPDIGHHREHGTLAALGGDGTGARYRVVSARPYADRRERARDRLPVALPRSLALAPDHERALADFVEELPGGTPYDRLEHLEQLLRSDRFGYDPDAAPGHSIGRLARFLGVGDGPPVRGADRTGTSEQPAAAFAVVARALGFQARVVVGYDLPPTAFGGHGPADVTADRIHAWAEVQFESLGWVAFDPTNPRERAPDTTPPDGGTLPETETTEPDPEPPSPGETIDDPTGREPGGRILVVVVLATIGGALLVHRIQQVVRRGLQRRRRRRTGPPEDRVLGAWHEIGERLGRRQLPATPATRPADVVRACRQRLGEPVPPRSGPDLAVPDSWSDDRCLAVATAIDRLVPVLDAALYAPGGPTDEQATKAWAAHDDVAAALARRPRRPGADPHDDPERELRAQR